MNMSKHEALPPDFKALFLKAARNGKIADIKQYLARPVDLQELLKTKDKNGMTASSASSQSSSSISQLIRISGGSPLAASSVARAEQPPDSELQPAVSSSYASQI